MQALSVTNQVMRKSCIPMEPYAGPQCYSQLKERLMVNAPDAAERGEGEERRGGGVGDGMASVAEQMEKCWLTCDDCGARRLIERKSLVSLRSDVYQRAVEGSEPGFWGKWLSEARGRYDAFLASMGEGVDANGGGAPEEGTGPSNASGG